MNKYIVAGDKLLAFNAKCCTSSFIREIVRTYYPDIEQLISTAAYPEGKSADNTQHHNFVTYRVNPDRPVVLLVRDPVERFRSAMAQHNLTAEDVDGVLDELRDETTNYVQRLRGPKLAANVHFLPQDRFAGDVSYFRAPDQIAEAAAALGIAVPGVINESEAGSKPDLTAEQIDRVRSWYADDVALWESLNV